MEKQLIPCKHLDYETKYESCEIRTMAPHYPEVQYWERGKVWTDNGPGEKPNPSRCQFCKVRGRLYDIFGCYTGETFPGCYEPVGKV